MDNAELAARLGEAFRKYAFQIMQGNISPWQPLGEADSMTVTVTWDKNGNKVKFTEFQEPPKTEVTQTTETPLIAQKKVWETEE